MSSAPQNLGQLESWKEIAAYFRRDVRTVRRWEKERKLPVHRYPGGERGRVYARVEELEKWFRGVDQAALAAEPEVGDGDVADGHDSLEIANGSSGSSHSAGMETLGTPEFVAPIRKRGYWMVYGAVGAAAVLLVGLLFGNLILMRLGLRHADASRDQSTLQSSHKPNAMALELYLKGRYYWNRRTGDDLNQALDLFTQAVVRDPQYAAAYAGMADSYLLLREYTNMSDQDAYARASAAAQRAIQLDDGLSEAHRALAFALYFGKHDEAGAEAEFKRAIALDANDADAHHWYATMLLTVGRIAEAQTEIDLARGIEPTSASILADRNVILYAGGKTQESIEGLKQLEAADPKFASPPRYLADLLFMQGRFAEALEQRGKLAEILGDPVLAQTVKAAQAALSSGGEAAMLRTVAAANSTSPKNPAIDDFALAQQLSLLGMKKEALEALELARKHGDEKILSAAEDPAFQSLEGNKDFLAIVRGAPSPVPSH